MAGKTLSNAAAIKIWLSLLQNLFVLMTGLKLNFFMRLPIGQPASKFWLPKWKLWLPIPQNSVAQNTEEFLYFAVINSNAVNVKDTVINLSV